MNIHGSRILLTGATGGLGEGLARALRIRGAELVLTGRRVEVLQGLASEIGAVSIAADLSRAEDAALPAVGPVVDFTEAEIARAIDVNLLAPILLSRAVTPQFIERGYGHIVLIGSLAGRAASKGSSMYNATKFGLRGFALAHRQDLHGTGVGVSLVEPTFVSGAGMYGDSGVELHKGVRTASPRDVSKAVIRAVEKDVAEIVVAPVEQRAQAALALIAPSWDARLQRAFGVDEIFASHGGVTQR